MKTDPSYWEIDDKTIFRFLWVKCNCSKAFSLITQQGRHLPLCKNRSRHCRTNWLVTHKHFTAEFSNASPHRVGHFALLCSEWEERPLNCGWWKSRCEHPRWASVRHSCSHEHRKAFTRHNIRKHKLNKQEQIISKYMSFVDHLSTSIQIHLKTQCPHAKIQTPALLSYLTHPHSVLVSLTEARCLKLKVSM